MTKSEENKLDQLHDNLLDIENHAKSLNLNKNDNHRYILTDIVNITESQKREKLDNNDLKSCLNDIKNKLNEQQIIIDDLIKKISK